MMIRKMILLFIIPLMSIADVDIDNYVVPVKVIYSLDSIITGWIDYNKYQVQLPETNDSLELPIESELFVNRLRYTEKLPISRRLYQAPDGKIFFYADTISMKDIRMIVFDDKATLPDTYTYSGPNPPFGYFSSPWVDTEIYSILVNRTPVIIDTIVVEEDIAYYAWHTYVFDSTINLEDVKVSFINEYNQGGQKQELPHEIQKALEDKRIIRLEEVSP